MKVLNTGINRGNLKGCLEKYALKQPEGRLNTCTTSFRQIFPENIKTFHNFYTFGSKTEKDAAQSP